MGWGYIDKCKRGTPNQIWIGVEPCETEEQGKTRAMELERADPFHEYQVRKYLDLPLFITFKSRPDRQSEPQT